ncbi:carboxypeptidase-like regulatory domain-containing protein [Tautonia plasticadhaerens]|uniref:Carboxypeptidase regulatory-like domain-containing protein n=1 Tax=Tautonia plasticadhaerens TaxID=2527974 RepID=A0A518HBR5_9BACT|nr:carboxypeptidase-like regulatory domain-containing protein [Tautonia plasticadhaerens]QDV38285.1 hypothetical protein ElP_62360 [Tautonia plasticadhaerens]
MKGQNSQELIVPDEEEPGPVRLEVGEFPWAGQKPVEIAQYRYEADLDAPPPGEERSLTGRAVDEDDRPCVGFRVYYDEPDLLVETTTDRQGISILGGLPPGLLRITIARNGTSDSVVEAEVGPGRDDILVRVRGESRD